MSRKAMSLKAKIREFAKEKDMSAQVILQNYMFERFLERLSKSDCEALENTVEHRKTTHIFDNIQNRIKAIESSEILEARWIRYSKNYSYAENITYEDTVDALRKLINN